ncbi:hypothetical protein FS837_006724 [Tulasnella sp. UAMH 9824]|nr:hypothetical protein FS837_006724 [Tulasnella sp. UAMH 9824]
MNFISRLLRSWTFFLFLVIQRVNDSEVTKALLPFLPLILSVVATTCLIHDLILSQPLPHTTSQTTSSSSVNWPKSGAWVITGAPITTLTPLSVGVLDRPQASTWSGALRGCAPLALLALAIFIALIAWFSSRHSVARDLPAPSLPLLTKNIRRLPSFSTVHQHSPTPLAPESQPTDFACPSSIPSPGESETAATTSPLHQALSYNQNPAPTPPSSAVDSPPRLPDPDQDGEPRLPLLGWSFTSSAVEDEDEEDEFDDDDDDQLWWEAEDDQPIQIKEVARGVVPPPSRVEDEAEEGEDVAPTSTPATTFGPGIRPLIPRGHLNPNIEALQVHPNQETIAFPSFGSEKDANTAPTSTLLPAGASRGWLRVPNEKPKTNIELLQPRLGWRAIPYPSHEDEDDEAARQRLPSFTRPSAPSRPLPPIPAPWRCPNVQRMLLRTPLPAWIEEEEEKEEDSPGQDRLPLSTSKPGREASTSTTSTAFESPANATFTNSPGKLSAVNKVVSFLHFTKGRQDHEATKRVSHSSRLRKVLSKIPPLRFGKQFFKKKTEPL